MTATAPCMLIVAPHHDDESIGAGGIIADYTRRGGEAHVVTVFTGESGLPESDVEVARQIRNAELTKAAEVLGVSDVQHLNFPDRSAVNPADIARALIHPLRGSRPMIVLGPHAAERDPEHVAVALAVREAIWLAANPVFPSQGAPCPPVQLLLGYEVWTPIKCPQLLIDITDVMERKNKAVGCHRSQLAGRGWQDGIRGLASYRGVQSGLGEYVEAFEIYTVASEWLLPWFTSSST